MGTQAERLLYTHEGSPGSWSGRIEVQLLKSRDHNLHGRPVEAPTLTLDQYNAVAIALREKGLLGAQTETVLNDWTGRVRTIVNAVWLTPEGRHVVEGLQGARE